jgi:serine/threonine protein kinase
LGKGGFGQVFEGRRLSDNNPTVLKFLPKDYILNWGTLDGVCNSFDSFINLNLCFLETCSI